ncbi:ABC transporter permease [Uliginosibacterium sp. sgz301328]|uniref:ABC transporter permease n=1 Tax=Uliginosibacterium sp. sgz301328 TaxID=3243764 RepID=UPI00359E83D5
MFSYFIERLPSITDNLGAFAAGAWTTIWLVGTALLLGLLIAVPAGIVLARSEKSWLRWLVAGYSHFFRGTPMLVQAYIIYYGVGLQLSLHFPAIQEMAVWPILREAWPWALLALMLNTGAYTSEIVRGAIETTPQGEIEAARAMGMSPGLAMRRIVLPSAARRAMSAYGNEIIFLLQGSAIVSTITIADITGVARDVYANYSEPYLPFMMAGLLYLLITSVVVFAFRLLEKRYFRHLKTRTLSA